MIRYILMGGVAIGAIMTLVSLGAGLGSMASSSSRYSNRFMRLRLASQGLAILCVVGLATLPHQDE